MKVGQLLLSVLGLPLIAHAQTYTKTETIEYHDDLSLWVLGQVKRTTTNDTETSRTEYAWKASPTKTYAFGKLQQTIGYYTSDGTISHVLDANSNRTIYRAWMRGIPQSIEYADGTTERAAVNAEGLIYSHIDEVGARSCYEYDPMGRLARVVYTSEVQPPITEWGACDTSDWNATTQIFEPVTTGEYGVLAGHWRQTVSTGNAYKITYFDALWRPLVVREYDNTDISGTQRFQRFAYDHAGRVTFASYPSTVDNPTTGSWTSYDALGRVTAVSQDSELAAPNDVLTTLTQYLSGFQTRVTNPKGQVTTISYMAYDQPAYDLPVSISHPEGAYTDIVRDVFGKPKTLTRRNTSSSLQVQRHFVYDSHQRLCKSIEPETGTTLYGYDDAGNLLRTDFGMPAFPPGPCDEPTMTAMAAPPTGGNNPPQMAHYALRTYDVRNRIQTLTFPDHNGDQTWTYTPDGFPQRIVTLNSEGRDTVVNDYFYNRRRLLTRETLSQPGWYNWPVDYDYNRNGHLFGQLYPNGLYVEYGVNALGQPTRAGNFATGVQYYPNGAIKQFTYGNGVVHTMTQNARQLPARSTDSGGVLDLDTRFDSNGNVSDIYDVARGAHYNRHMQYDGLDRLTAVGSGVFGGDTWHRFTYDALDNMTSWKLAGVKDYADYVYDPTSNQLTNIKNSAGATVVGLGYDQQGNLRNKNGQGYLFDYGNRLREAEEREGYFYDGYGRRILSWRPDGGLNFFLYGQAGQLWYQEYAAKSLAVENVYLAGSLVATREFDWNAGTFTSKYHHTDALGSPVAVTNTAGQVTERTDWEPYGAAIGKPSYEGIGFTGHVQDAATGLTYMQQRYYDPLLGRFLSVDPVTANGVTGANFNRYWYANNNPYKFTDPDGRIAFCAVPPITFGCIAVGKAIVDAIIVVGAAVVIAAPVVINNEPQEGEAQVEGSEGAAEPGTAESEEGAIYVVDGSNTSSGKDYVGSTDNKPNREKDSSDGRNRKDSTTVDKYPKGDREARQNAEQKAMNERGGKDNLDNKRNEIRESNWEKRGINPP